MWRQLTDPNCIVAWMIDTDIHLSVQTTGQVDSPITIRGHLHGAFETKGVILACEPEQLLSYTSLDSISGQEDSPPTRHR